MIKKQIIGIIVGLILILSMLIYVRQARSNSEVLFGIDENDYKIIKKENTLSVFGEYSGDYYLKLEVKESRMNDFIGEIEKAGFTKVDIDSITDERLRQKNIEAYEEIYDVAMNKRLRDTGTVYKRKTKAKRFILGKYGSRIVYNYIEIAKHKNEIYEVCLYYTEN